MRSSTDDDGHDTPRQARMGSPVKEKNVKTRSPSTLRAHRKGKGNCGLLMVNHAFSFFSFES